ncbi:MAG: F0F1 ATP synthase subunit delta [Duncaniella sp.]|nr:F0F1 ATP synthase subunit delta [Muribaculum sp.]MCM1255139.1 F0F1 ATP synthase subunit delta [Duncaniella sp.]
MNEGLIPSRYAKALFEYAGENKDDKHIYDMMHKLHESFVAEPSLQQVMANPFVAAADKVKLLTIAAGADAEDKVYAQFLQLLVENNRLAAARDIALAYMKIYRREHKIYLVNVTSAAPFGPAEEERLKKLIERHLNGGTMEYNHSVDPDLIGGFVVNINNEKLDASIANELKQLRLKLLSK